MTDWQVMGALHGLARRMADRLLIRRTTRRRRRDAERAATLVAAGRRACERYGGIWAPGVPHGDPPRPPAR